jgi:hypothetical protein
LVAFFGQNIIKLQKKIEALLANKQLAINVGSDEYVVFISMERPKDLYPDNHKDLYSDLFK